MLHRIRMDEESSSDAGSYISSEGGGAASVSSSDLEKLDLNAPATPSMSSVYRTSEDGGVGGGSRPGSRPASPSHSSSGSIFHRRGSSRGSSSDKSSKKKKKKQEDHLCRWLQAGNVVYKSVGLGLMDLTVGMKVVEFARQKGVGTLVDGF